MSTILYENIIFGPIISRRLGHSLGVNLLPKQGKWCSFDCIYCECGWNKDHTSDTVIPNADEVERALRARLIELKRSGTPVDTITFSGNGEPTLNPQFPEIIDLTLKLRDEYYPKAVVSVLSNASRIGIKEIREALMKVDNPILKIDSVSEEMVNEINRPNSSYSLKTTIENLKLFNGNFILQTMFLKGIIGVGEGYANNMGNTSPITIDSTDAVSCENWRKLVEVLKPREVMMYTLDRETPANNLKQVTINEMKKIAEPLIKKGFKIQIKGPSGTKQYKKDSTL
jgi:wyosine [tRNA(Phe)-imidazoG37] synthetase (radical SAM superfamily)